MHHSARVCTLALGAFTVHATAQAPTPPLLGEAVFTIEYGPMNDLSDPLLPRREVTFISGSYVGGTWDVGFQAGGFNVFRLGPVAGQLTYPRSNFTGFGTVNPNNNPGGFPGEVSILLARRPDGSGANVFAENRELYIARHWQFDACVKATSGGTLETATIRVKVFQDPNSPSGIGGRWEIDGMVNARKIGTGQVTPDIARFTGPTNAVGFGIASTGNPDRFGTPLLGGRLQLFQVDVGILPVFLGPDGVLEYQLPVLPNRPRIAVQAGFFDPTAPGQLLTSDTIFVQ